MAWVEKRGAKYVGFFRDATGKKHRGGSADKPRAALKAAQDRETDVRRGTYVDDTNLTFGDYFEKDWLPNRIGELNSLATWRSHYQGYLKPAFGSMPLSKVTAPVVQRWVVSLQKGVGRRGKPLAPSTIVAIHRTLATTLGARKGVSAVRDGLIAKSPCEGTTLPVVDRKMPATYEVNEIALLMEALPEYWRPLVALAADSGLRWGELLGLQVNDFTADFASFTVQRSLVQLTKADVEAFAPGADSRFIIKPRPKNRRSRKVALLPDAATVVQKMVRERRLFPIDRLFSMPDGDGMPRRSTQWPTGVPVGRSYFRAHVWVPAHERTVYKDKPLKVRKVHALRASHITWLLAGGADVATVMQRVGHADLATTQLYVGMMADADRRALDALEITRKRAQGE